RADPVLGPEGERIRTFQFHGEGFALPEGAVRLAGSEACPQQAFRVGDRAYGLQFHLELLEGFADFVPDAVRPDPAERAQLCVLARRIADRFFTVATAPRLPALEVR
ncbi:MAG TPA: hypothetical protein VIL49_02020, partial [Capillimicrobium sp.]